MIVQILIKHQVAVKYVQEMMSISWKCLSIVSHTAISVSNVNNCNIVLLWFTAIAAILHDI